MAVTANEIKESISQIAVEDDTTEAKAAAANDVCGKFGDGKYTNAYFDISYTLPDNFAFKSNQEIADIVGSEIDASTGVAKFSQASMDMYYDSAAFSSASGASIMTICVPSGALLKVADLSEKELLEAVTQGVTESYDGAQISDPYSLSVADKSCTAVDVTFSSEGVEMNALYFVTSKNNSYFVTQIISSQYDTSSAKQYIAYFS